MTGSGSRLRRTVGSAVAITALAAGTTFLVIPSAAADTKNPAFCRALSSEQDISGIGRTDAKKSVRLMKKAAKADVPDKVEQALKVLAAFYQRVADGDAPAKAIAGGGKKLTSAFTVLSKYTVKSCAPPVPST